ncbi:hypothetical protein [Terasakiella pusilla]|uniref:hypothetical protein n=1 Tax=Terasakiella pusilla TaxID=64973 RepID=UPI00048DE1F6|nr:hypothetical protein [Terasakiella pusilla]
MLTLKEFILDALTEITESINEFNENQNNSPIQAMPDLKGIPKEVMESHGLVQLGFNRGKDRTDYACILHFDVAITTEAESTGQKGGGIKVLAVNATIGKADKSRESSNSRLSFSIPVKIR